MNERTRRLFFALWPDDAMREQIEAATRVSVRQSGGRPIPPENFHITLAFLGSMPESRIDDLHRCALATPIEAFDLEFGEINEWKHQAVLCLEPIAGQDALNGWVLRLRASLEASGFEIERRPFRAHITLCRDVRFESATKLSIPPLRWTARRMELIESTLGDGGSSYRVVTNTTSQK